jgi:prepilin-type N-terminal cleavage/methylation domain-containing protein/prepilin-type processing-associated H-X9-DG protein
MTSQFGSSRGGTRCEKRDLQRAISAASAFSLIELLVVIAIVAILAALLLPGLARAKATAKRIHCTNNLHQIATAVWMYAEESGRYPPYWGSSGAINTSEQARSTFWDGRVLPYLSGNTAIFLCPGQTGTNNNVAANWNHIHSVQDVPNLSYALNGIGVGFIAADGLVDGLQALGLNTQSLDTNLPYYIGQPASSTVAPADMIAVVDYDPYSQVAEWPFVSSFTGKRHNGGAVGGFCDTHVEYAKMKRWGAPELLDLWARPVMPKDAGSRVRWNNDHLPHLEAQP